MSSGNELGVNVFSAYIDVPPGGSVVLKLSMAGYLPQRGTYGLSLRQQPMVNPDQVTVEVTPAPGWTGAAAWTPDSDVSQHHEFSFRRS